MQQGLGTNKQRYNAADGQTRCRRQAPGREALLQEPVLIQPPPARMVDKGTELQALSGVQAPQNRALMCVGELLQEQVQGQGSFTRELVLRPVHVFILSSPLPVPRSVLQLAATQTMQEPQHSSLRVPAQVLTCYFKYCFPSEMVWQKNKTPR